MEFIKHRIDILLDQAKSGDPEAQYQLANSIYYGENVERSFKSARYWAFKALENGNDKASYLYRCIVAPHFTGNEKYTSFGERYNINWGNMGIWGSHHFHGKYDIYDEDERIYRTYTHYRVLCFYMPTFQAYRVIETQPNSFQVLGTEKIRWLEMLTRPVISIPIVILLLIMTLV